MKISFSGIWDDTVRMLRANAALFLAIAGVFLFLPALVLGYFAPQPTGGGQPVAAPVLAEYYRRNLPLIALVWVLAFIGNLTILVLALDQSRPTVAGAIGHAFRLLWRYFLVSLIAGLMLGLAFAPALMLSQAAPQRAAAALGALVLMIPALYLAARLAPAGPVIVAEPGIGPIATIKRSFAVSKGAGWSILGLILVVCIVFIIVNLAATVALGSILLALDRVAGTGGVGAFLLALVQGVIGAGFNLVLVVLLASLYRRLTGAASTTGI